MMALVLVRLMAQSIVFCAALIKAASACVQGDMSAGVAFLIFGALVSKMAAPDAGEREQYRKFQQQRKEAMH